MQRFLLLLFFYSTVLSAQVYEPVSPYSGMAGADNALFSPWSIYSNQAGISRLTESYAGTSYRHLFDLSELGLKTLFVTVPTVWGTLGATFNYFGYSKYNQQLWGAAYGRQLSRWMDLGIKLNYIYTKVDKQPSGSNSCFFDVGAIFTVVPAVRIGLNTSNPFEIASGKSEERLYIPEVYAAGVSWDVDECFLLAFKIENRDKQYFFSSGVAYSYRKVLDCYCGFKPRSDSFYSGVCVKHGPFELSLLYNTHDVLGNMLGVAVGAKFERNGGRR